MSAVLLIVGLLLAVVCLAGAAQVTGRVARLFLVVAGVSALVGTVPLSSLRYIPPGSVGIVTKNALGRPLPVGKIIATEGETGIQAEVLPAGWRWGYWPVVYDVQTRDEIEVPAGYVGLVESRDGLPLEPGQVFAPEVDPGEFTRLIEDAAYFLGEGGGRKGAQSNVLTAGRYRLNTALFDVRLVPTTDVPNAAVAVLKANFGSPASVVRPVADTEEPVRLAAPGEKGVRQDPLEPGSYPINPAAFEVTLVSTRETIVRFTSAARAGGLVVEQNVQAPARPASQPAPSAQRRVAPMEDAARASDLGKAGPAAVGPQSEEREITVRTSDGFTFPVDVRIEYKIDPADAPVVVAKLGSDGNPLLSKMNSTVRAIFRNNAESVTALDYVNQRSEQERRSLAMLREEMSRVGVTIVAVRIGDVGDEATLGDLLKTQRDRQIAIEERQTFQIQQAAAEQRKELTRAQQEAEEERRLATASYEVQIAEQDRQRRLIAARAEAEAIETEAKGRAEAFKLVAEQIGRSNAALVELLKIIGQNQIQITPRVMVTNGNAGGQQAQGETVALIGTMLDAMIEKNPESPRP